MPQNDAYIITSVTKALKVLKAFLSDDVDYTLTQLSQKCGIGKTSMLRILTSLQSEGFVKYNTETRKYHLGLILYQLGTSAYRFMDIKKICYPILKDVAVRSGQIVHLAVLAEDEIVVVDRIYAEVNIDILGLVSKVGGTVPVHCTGVGYVLAAFSDPEQQERLISKCDFVQYSNNTICDPEKFKERLSVVKKEGFAINDGEHESFLRCITRPIFGANGKVLAAFSISGLRETMQEDKMQEYHELSKQAAIALGKEF